MVTIVFIVKWVKWLLWSLFILWLVAHVGLPDSGKAFIVTLCQGLFLLGSTFWLPSEPSVMNTSFLTLFTLGSLALRTFVTSISFYGWKFKTNLTLKTAIRAKWSLCSTNKMYQTFNVPNQGDVDQPFVPSLVS